MLMVRPACEARAELNLNIHPKCLILPALKQSQQMAVSYSRPMIFPQTISLPANPDL
ncbi:hypothetical protein MPLSOD_120052 [Mesorhizobium sp. SOD10]|nr:hypothetical protein MPLSOD_120052 [Mesorhizobium sp. SOD10]